MNSSTVEFRDLGPKITTLTICASSLCVWLSLFVPSLCKVTKVHVHCVPKTSTYILWIRQSANLNNFWHTKFRINLTFTKLPTMHAKCRHTNMTNFNISTTLWNPKSHFRHKNFRISPIMNRGSCHSWTAFLQPVRHKRQTGTIGTAWDSVHDRGAC